jgi:hypothetical protein
MLRALTFEEFCPPPEQAQGPRRDALSVIKTPLVA